ncbi:centromere protein U [Nematolebias whitei]|uniref:centromere protein U n=1 Tax=Nematolebias whitei TaxID=451745 RepID=UPI00189AB10A|nr:centromere protein U [Nematolebias whitei]
MRRAKKKVVPDPPDPEDRGQMGSPDLSSIDRASFMEGLQQDLSNPLHSTALEEALNVQVDKRTLKTPGKGHTVERTGTKEEDVDKRRRSIRVKDKTRGQVKEDKTTGTGPRDKTSDSQEATGFGAVHKTHGRVLSSEGTDEDTSWNQSPKKTKVLSSGRPRTSLRKRSRSKKSSSDKRPGDGATSGQTSDRDRQRRKGPAGPGGSHFEVVLDAFQYFCDQYSESVQPAAVRESIRSFSRNTEEQLLEKISSLKQLQTLKRDNVKAAASIRTKTQRLLAAKAELMRAERQVCLLQKEEGELQQRLSDIKQGHSFLRGLRGLSRWYLDHRRQHGANTETYGASSLPALLLEAKLLQVSSRDETTNNQRPEQATATA